MTIAKYLRLSDADGDLNRGGKDESNSIVNQRNLLDSFIQQKEDFSNAAVLEFCDDGWSGKNFERPAVTEMLSQVKQGKIQCIIVKDLSRFGRDYLTVGNYISSVFPFLGVRFIAVNDGLDSARPGDVDSLDTSFKALLYDLYSRDLSRKVKSAKRLRAKRGDFVAPFAPYGYQKDPQNHSRLIIDPPAAETVRRIFRLIANGHSAVQIAKLLNSESIPTPMLYKRAAGCSRSRWPSVREDNFWTGHSVAKILRDERYLGMNIYLKRERDIVGSTHTVKVCQENRIKVAHAHKGIVTQDEFDRAQAALRDFKEHSPYTEKQPLARKVRCGECGHILTRSNGKEKYYYCQTHRMLDGTGCIEVHILEKELLAAILDSLRAQAAAAVDMGKLYEEQHKNQQNSKASQLQNQAALKEKEGQLNREAKDLYERFALGEISREEYLSEKETVSAQRAAIQKQIWEIDAALNKTSQQPENPALAVFQKYADVQELTPEILSDILQEVRVYTGGRLEIVWKYGDLAKSSKVF